MSAAPAAQPSSSRVVWLNGRMVPLADARVSALDRGFLFGDGVYEVISIYQGRPFLLGQHLQRLRASLDAVRIPDPHADGEWERLVNEVVEANGAGHQHVYLQVTRGPAPIRDHVFPEAIEPTVFIMATPARPIPAEWVRDGIRAITRKDNRWGQCNVKSTMLLANVLLRQQAQEAGAQEALLLRDGYLTEGAASSAFIVQRGRVITPPDSDALLPGITRDFILDLCRQNGQECHERDVAEEELRTADEVWITSSTREILAVTILDDRTVGSGKPGAYFKQVYDWFQEAVAGS